MSKTPRPPITPVERSKVPAPVRVRLKRVNCNEAIPYPPDGQAREWWQRLRNAFGTASSAFVQASLYQLINAARLPGSGISEIAVNASLALIEGAKPQREIEAALALQMACTHAASMAVLATLAGPHGPDRNLAMKASAAARLTRAYATQVETLRRLKNGGSQVIRVERVYVNEGGQKHQNVDEQFSGTSTAPGKSNATEEAVANYTKWLAIFTAFLVLATIGLFISGERNIEVARESADVAKVSAKALISGERAHVLFKQITIMGIEEIAETGSAASPTFTYELINSGKSPAWIKKPLFKVDVRRTPDPFPPDDNEPDYITEPKATIDTNVAILPGASRKTIDGFSIPGFVVDQKMAKELLDGTLYLTIYGYIEYADIFESVEGLRFFGFCYQYRFGRHLIVEANAPKYWRYK